MKGSGSTKDSAQNCEFLHYDRLSRLFNALNKSPNLKILLQIGQNDYYRNASMALAFWLRGNYGRRVVVTDDKCAHNGTFNFTFEKRVQYGVSLDPRESAKFEASRLLIVMDQAEYELKEKFKNEEGFRQIQVITHHKYNVKIKDFYGN